MIPKIGLFAVILTVVIIAVQSQNPLRQSDVQIREEMLEHIPLGTSMDDVIKFVGANTKWQILHIHYDRGYEFKYGHNDKMNEGVEPSKKYILVYLGHYQNIFQTGVRALYGFDENSELTKIYIGKMTDSL